MSRWKQSVFSLWLAAMVPAAAVVGISAVRAETAPDAGSKATPAAGAASPLADSLAPAFSAADLEFFEKRVRPVLVQNCFECHSARKIKAGLRLDSRASILKGGESGAVVVPGKPAESRLIAGIGYKDPDLQMPPKGRIAEEQIADLTKWIEMGLPWPEEAAAKENAEAKEPEFDLQARKAAHWAWRAIEAASPPEVPAKEWNEHPVDKFVYAKLAENGLAPAAEADRRSLARRLYFDLLGLPPAPEAVEAFVGDGSPDAYEKLVDQLLASPAFGERWGRHWLDLMRYAESYGHEQDYPIREAWRYRDYVIRALNADVPYDKFVTEHIAGDLVSPPRMNPEEGFNESIIGTGFWHFGQQTHSPVDPPQDHADRIDNQIDVFSKAFLGLTVACARCHDHKFDAISAKDYYALAGILISARRQEAPLDPGGKIGAACGELSQLAANGNELFSLAMRQAAEPAAAKVAEYLEAAREVMFGEWEPEDGEAALRPDILFDDFESGFGNWSAQGTAFGDRPRREAGTLAATSRDDAETTGTLRSRPFVIERGFIRFRLGGGANEEKLYAALIVNGEIARKATAGSGEALAEVVWDVQEFRGKAAAIEVVDRAGAKGAFIALDRIYFGEDTIPSVSRPIESVAAERGLDAERLRKWVNAIGALDPKDRRQPLYAWQRAAMRRGALEGDDFARGAAAFREEMARAREQKPQDGSILIEDFNGETYGAWTATGWAFGQRPSRGGEAAAALAADGLIAPGTAHSGLVAPKLEGTLRSATFKLEKPRVHYRVKGRGAKIRLVIDGYQLREFNPLLFTGTLSHVDTGNDFVWITQSEDMAKFVGHDAYIELIDDGEGYLAVDEIRMSEGDAPAEGPSEAALALAEAEPPASGAALAAAYQRLAKEAAASYPERGIASPGGGLLAWMRRNGLVDLGLADTVIAAVAERVGAASKELPAPMRVVASTEGTPRDMPIYLRGSHKTPGEIAHRRFLEALAGTEQPPIQNGTGRLELAQRLFDPSDPLPARVAANRIWKHLFGEGIVRSVDNFGALGTPPTHPELLDYLAERFRTEEGWSVKRMIKFLALSRAYRMSSRPADAAAEERDPANLLVHRANVKRMEGEILRDSLLAVSGRLDPQMYGPPIPIVITPFMDGRNRPESGPVDGNGRRSIYMTVRRGYLSPMMLTFDAPIPDSTVGRRNVSNVPAQSLVLMNDPFVVGQAELLARRMLAEPQGGAPERVRKIYLTALGREPSDAELFRALAFLRRQGMLYDPNAPAGPDDVKLWTDFCHVVFNLKEFIYVG